MRMKSKILIAIVSLIMFLGTPSLKALWIEDGIVVCTASGVQYFPRIISDDHDGAIIVWEDARDMYQMVYAQKVDSHGNVQWVSDGLSLTTGIEGDHQSPAMASDGAGGVIVTWHDTRNSSEDIFVQRIDAAGNVMWGPGGTAICTAAGMQYSPAITADGSGGAIIVWEDLRTGGIRDIYAQKIDAMGAVQWTVDGVAICTAAFNQYDPKTVSDGSGGAIITWQDNRNSEHDIYAQKITASGNISWTADGVPVCIVSGGQDYPDLISDGGGGAVIAWWDERGGQHDIYAQRILHTGSARWTTGGVPVCEAAGSQALPRLVPDGSGGAIISWHDLRGATVDIYAQRIDTWGNVLWTVDGVAVCTAVGTQAYPEIARNGTGGAIITWQDERSSNRNIYAQCIDADGDVQWATDGVALCMAGLNQSYPMIAYDGSGGAIVTWEDNGNVNIYAQRIERNGYWGYPGPYILAARDIPGDQGGFVNLSWEASRLDPWPEQGISSYTVWRAIGATGMAPMIDDDTVILTDMSDLSHGMDGTVLRMEQTPTGNFYWKLISTIDVYYLESYSEIVPTLFDSTATSDEHHYFQVIAHTSDPLVFWISPPDSGYSVDNLAPAAPLSFAGEQLFVPEGLQLTWDPNNETDLAGYNIYRGTSESFEPGPGSFLTSTPDTFSLDDGWDWSTGYWYKVAAVDVHGNEGDFAALGPDMLTGDDPKPLPDASFLAQNFPNPFNPQTMIRFGLKEASHVSLRIYDPAGRLVRVLVDGQRDTGQYEERWGGLDDAGRSVASGIFFYRLVAGNFVQTRKMVFLR